MIQILNCSIIITNRCDNKKINTSFYRMFHKKNSTLLQKKINTPLKKTTANFVKTRDFVFKVVLFTKPKYPNAMLDSGIKT